MDTISPDNQLDTLFGNIQLAPGERFYRRMSRAAWTPAGVARRRITMVAGLTLLLTAAFLALTPMGRAWAQEVFQLFTRAAGDTLPVPTAAPLGWVNVTPGTPLPTTTPRASFSDCGDFDRPICSVAQIRGKVNFLVTELKTIPEGMHFVGATGDPSRVALIYANDSWTFGLTLWEEPWTGSSELTQWPVGSSAVIESVQVGSVTGEYVKGSFSERLQEAPTFSGVHFTQVWDPNAGVETLHWIDGGIFYSMSAWDNDPDLALPERDAFTALAAGLTTIPVSALQPYVSPTATVPAPVTFEGDTYTLSLAQAETHAGFTVRQHARLPETFLLSGAAYLPDQQIVRIFYVEPPLDPFLVFGLRLSQQPISGAADCSLCNLTRGDYSDFLSQKNRLVVAQDTVVEEVQIGTGTGQYVEGQWGPGPSGWAWLPYTAIKTLRWQANGMAFELKYSGYFTASGSVPVSKDDLIAIAESIK